MLLKTDKETLFTGVTSDMDLLYAQFLRDGDKILLDINVTNFDTMTCKLLFNPDA